MSSVTNFSNAGFVNSTAVFFFLSFIVSVIQFKHIDSQEIGQSWHTAASYTRTLTTNITTLTHKIMKVI